MYDKIEDFIDYSKFTKEEEDELMEEEASVVPSD